MILYSCWNGGLFLDSSISVAALLLWLIFHSFWLVLNLLTMESSSFCNYLLLVFDLCS